MTSLSAPPVNLNDVAKGDTFTDPDSGIRYVVQSFRPTAKGCKFCGQGASALERDSGRGVWWAAPEGEPYKWTLINQDGTSHHATCTSKPKGQFSTGGPKAKPAAPKQPEPPWDVPEPEAPKFSRTPGEAISDPLVRQLVRDGFKIKAIKEYRILCGASLLESKNAIEALAKQLGDPQPQPEVAGLTAAQVQAMIDKAVAQATADTIEVMGQAISDAKASMGGPVVIEFKQPEGKSSITVKNAHKDLADVVAALRQGLNVFMVGMAGTGKTTLAAHAAEAMGLQLYDVSMSPDAGRHLLTGYQTADGTFMPPALYQAFRYGGLFHFDECDNSNPGLIVVVNQILSNGHMRFADGELVTKHPDFRAMASGNTYGNGPTSMYVGRQPLDWAFKNRWIMLTVLVDERVEEAMCLATGAPVHDVHLVLAYVRALRQSATEQQLELLFTPRNSEHMCKLIAAGWSKAKAVEAAIRMGASETDWRKVHRTDSPYSSSAAKAKIICPF